MTPRPGEKSRPWRLLWLAVAAVGLVAVIAISVSLSGAGPEAVVASEGVVSEFEDLYPNGEAADPGAQTCTFTFKSDGSQYDLTPFKDTIGYHVYNGTFFFFFFFLSCVFWMGSDVEAIEHP